VFLAASQHIATEIGQGLFRARTGAWGSISWVLQNRTRAYSGLIPVPVAIPFWLPGCAVGWLSPTTA